GLIGEIIVIREVRPFGRRLVPEPEAIDLDLDIDGRKPTVEMDLSLSGSCAENDTLSTGDCTDR
ncbi:unnamed protein product, partial [Rotaria socialis]